MDNIKIKANINVDEHLKISDPENGRVILNKHENQNHNGSLTSKINVKGFVKIYDRDTGEVILDKTNAVHYENMSVALARSISSITEGNLYSMAFGNGGTVVNATGDITYMSCNTTGINATLYNQTYVKTNIAGVNETYDPSNNIEVNHLGGTVYSDIVITCTLGYNEPADQAAFDNNSGIDKYTFSEIGLLSTDGKLLTHVIFSPISKVLNRIITIEYTLRISLV